MEDRLTFGAALKIIFEYIQSSPAVLAEQYVDRDRTLVYKWLRDTAFPPKKLFPDIIRFVMECSGDSARDLIRMEMDRRLSEMELDAPLRKMLDQKPDFANYLESVFGLLAAEKARGKSPKQMEDTNLPETQVYWERPAHNNETEMPPRLPASASTEQAIHIRLTFRTMKFIGFALLASLSGEALWGMTAYAFKWSGVVSGFPAFFRGFLVLPVVAFAMLSLFEEAPPICALPKAMKLAYIGCYALAGGMGALLLAGSEPERLARGLLSGNVSQSLLLVFIQALILSFLPMLALFSLLRFPKVRPGAFLLLEFCPALVCALTALPAQLFDRTPPDGLWLGGIVPACALKLLMFLSARTVLLGYPDMIKMAFTKIPQE